MAHFALDFSSASERCWDQGLSYSVNRVKASVHAVLCYDTQCIAKARAEFYASDSQSEAASGSALSALSQQDGEIRGAGAAAGCTGVFCHEFRVSLIFLAFGRR